MTWQYEQQRAWADGYIPTIENLIAPYCKPKLIRATREQDCEQATDAIIFYQLEGQRLGLRMRKPDYLGYKNEFTIRAELFSGGKTELEKILVDGYADWLFYGFGIRDFDVIEPWELFGFHSVRKHIKLTPINNAVIEPRIRRVEHGIVCNEMRKVVVDGRTLPWYEPVIVMNGVAMRISATTGINFGVRDTNNARFLWIEWRTFPPDSGLVVASSEVQESVITDDGVLW